MPNARISWPDGNLFAFSIFDDTDGATVENVAPVYSFLKDNGFRTTKSVWPIRGTREPLIEGDTCENDEYLAWVRSLQKDGFEVEFHMATFHTSSRLQTLAGLQRFRRDFGYWPRSMANHADCQENVYWGVSRLSGLNRLIYNALTRGRNRNRFRGHIEGHPLLWGDYCRKYIKFVRNFVFSDINTLKACPYMPYHDPVRPYVNFWFASAEGADVSSYNNTLSEENQDRLEEEGGACIMYTHFASGFFRDGCIDAPFEALMTRLAKRRGWFVPVSTLLDYLRKQNGDSVISKRARRQLEAKWLLHKIRVGTA